MLGALGIEGDWPLILAFLILAAYTYQSGLRAPALIAVVKDSLIYITILVAVIYIPSKIGGFGAMFDAAEKALPEARPKPGALIPSEADAQVAYATLAFGSALALFLYPHAITAVLSAKSAQTIRRNAALLPAYTFLLGLIALLGDMAIARGIDPSDPNFAVPDLFLNVFPSWFVGFAFAAIAIGALVPAAVMSIAAANLFTRSDLQGLPQTAGIARRRGAGRQDRLAARQGRGARHHRDAADEVRDRAAAARRRVDPADAAVDRHRALHALAAPLGARRRLGRRHDRSGTLMAQSQDFAPTYPLEILGTTINAYTGDLRARRRTSS